MVKYDKVRLKMRYESHTVKLEEKHTARSNAGGRWNAVRKAFGLSAGGTALFLVSMIGMAAFNTTAVTEDGIDYHMVSYKNVPGYADKPMTELAVIDAVKIWNDANDDVQFVIVKYDANVKIVWRDYMKDPTLGEHRVYTDDDGEVYKHRIIVWLGFDDCDSNYHLVPPDLIKHTIMHEMGHYLGLQHTDDVDHLMYSPDHFDEDLAEQYDTLNLVIPYVEKPEIETALGHDIQVRMDQLYEELDQMWLQGKELRDTYNDGGDVTEQELDESTARHHDKVRQINELEDLITCVQM